LLARKSLMDEHPQRHPQPLAPDVWRLRAANPSPLTGTGTNCYILRGLKGAVLIDAGPDVAGHVPALMRALDGAALCAILITHAHLDHSQAAPALAAATGAKIYSFGPPAPHASDGIGSEGVDWHHRPDGTLQGGARVHLAGLDMTVLHTPGHMAGHLCFGYRDVLFTGDHVMGWSTSLVAPPQGDMAAYRASLRALQGQGYTRFLPGHGDVIETPEARLTELVAHRDMRAAQVMAALAKGPASPTDLAKKIYTDTSPALMPAAALNVLAHLIELQGLGRAVGALPHSQGAGTHTIFSAI
jgi:glyoxylase-like metal-dependent hydrolase (beta-lactamase superfamily II)